jgi:hypothetical protein
MGTRPWGGDRVRQPGEAVVFSSTEQASEVRNPGVARCPRQGFEDHVLGSKTDNFGKQTDDTASFSRDATPRRGRTIKLEKKWIEETRTTGERSDCAVTS